MFLHSDVKTKILNHPNYLNDSGLREHLFNLLNNRASFTDSTKVMLKYACGIPYETDYLDPRFRKFLEENKNTVFDCRWTLEHETWSVRDLLKFKDLGYKGE